MTTESLFKETLLPLVRLLTLTKAAGDRQSLARHYRCKTTAGVYEENTVIILLYHVGRHRMRHLRFGRHRDHPLRKGAP